MDASVGQTAMSEKHDTDKNAPSRRTMMKRVASGAATSAFLLPGAAAADEGSENEVGRTSPEIRAEKAAREGKEWNEEWINENRLNETWVETESPTTDDLVTAQAGRTVGGEIGVKGISIGIKGHFGKCKGWVEFSVLGQRSRYTLTCSKACASPHYDAGAAYVDLSTCFNWNKRKLRVKAKGCVWHVNGWSCASKKVVL